MYLIVFKRVNVWFYHAPLNTTKQCVNKFTHSETFAKPKMKPETVKLPSFPRRRESCLIFRNDCKNNPLFNSNQDSRLRGNDGKFNISCLILGFAKVSGYLGCKPLPFHF